MRKKTIQLLTIGKLAERTGISSDTLRYYEKMGLIKAASVSTDYEDDHMFSQVGP